MKRIIVLVFLAGITMLPPLSGEAAPPKKIYKGSFQATLPCTGVCPYWQTGHAAGMHECTKPLGKKGEFYDQIIVTAPKGAKLIEFRITPVMDYDSFICAGTGPPKLLGTGTNSLGGDCTGVLGPDDPSGQGCIEKVRIPVKAGRKYILRAYNWGDVAPCPYTYRYR